MHPVVMHFSLGRINVMIFEGCNDSVMLLDGILNVKNFTVIYILNARYMARQYVSEVCKKFILREPHKDLVKIPVVSPACFCVALCA